MIKSHEIDVMDIDKPCIAILLDSRQPGGIETHVLHLARGLQKSGIDPVILFLNRYGCDHPLTPLLTTHHLPFEYLDGHFSSTYQWLKRHQPLLLHTHAIKPEL